MKKILCSAVCALLLMTPVSVNAADEEEKEIITIEEGEISSSLERSSGDINMDSSVDIADVLVLKNILLDKNVSGKTQEEYFGDVNLDGRINVFDIIMIKQAILNGGDNLYVYKSALDITDKPVEDYSEKTQLITCMAELEEYLKIITDDQSRKNEYLSKYNEEFFENNNLAAGVIYQERGEGVMRIPSLCTMIKNTWFTRDEEQDDEVIYLISEDTYEYNSMLYPVTETYLFVQASLPKRQSENKQIEILDFSFLFNSDNSGYYYSSPDGKNEIYIVQASWLLISNIAVYRDNHDGTFEFLRYLDSDDGYEPFDDQGEWKKGENGEDIYTNDTGYIFHWYDDRVEIEYEWDSDEWKTDIVEF